jgi:hypothetical protein
MRRGLWQWTDLNTNTTSILLLLGTQDLGMRQQRRLTSMLYCIILFLHSKSKFLAWSRSSGFMKNWRSKATSWNWTRLSEWSGRILSCPPATTATATATSVTVRRTRELGRGYSIVKGQISTGLFTFFEICFRCAVAVFDGTSNTAFARLMSIDR